jgi:hypothetical protein
MDRMIRHPEAIDRYGFMEAKDQMPGFDETELADRELSVILKFLKGEYIANPPGTGSE